MGKTFTQSLTSRFWKLAPAIFTLPPDVLEAESACMGMSQLVPPPLRGVVTLSPASRCVGHQVVLPCAAACASWNSAAACVRQCTTAPPSHAGSGAFVVLMAKVRATAVVAVAPAPLALPRLRAVGNRARRAGRGRMLDMRPRHRRQGPSRQHRYVLRVDVCRWARLFTKQANATVAH